MDAAPGAVVELASHTARTAATAMVAITIPNLARFLMAESGLVTSNPDQRSAPFQRSSHFKAGGLVDGRMDLTRPMPWQYQLPICSYGRPV